MFKQLDLFGSNAGEKGKKPLPAANADKQNPPVAAETEPATHKDKETQPVAGENVPENNKKTSAKAAKKGKRGRKSIREMDAESAMISIPDDELLFRKQYYSIGEVAEMFGLNTSLLRYWETEFDILKPRKNRKGDRHFRPEDIKNLSLIHHLLRQRKYTIEGAKDYLKKNKSKAQQNFELIQRLEKLKRFLLELKAGL
ncbi:MerR family transcriptional regulator [Agriterribacter sp.]|uniref:MerR family transcriptional regulator n=1 Tax=Agriterribacter sp. TaxID=2821509 RepID=UPI002CC3B413|nr:MerR family transcriptional regulator [Agriterribacter sp.]HRP55973.1 MerR family transcriptional regulator [Agriterribacter sp.]